MTVIFIVILLIIFFFTFYPAYNDYFTRTRKGKPSYFTGNAKIVRDMIIALPFIMAGCFIIILLMLLFEGQI